jgi:transketolase
MLDLKQDADAVLRRIRRTVIDMAEHSPHVACALSSVEILSVLYAGVMRVSASRPGWAQRDRLVLSKGHGCMALYAVLHHAGFLDSSLIESYARQGSRLAKHPLAEGVPGIDFATGSLGHGLAVGAGMAASFKMQEMASRVFVVLGDGECDEGAVWEAAGLASAQRLDNLTALVDCNGLQACGLCDAISPTTSLRDCWAGFGWDVQEVDGHSVGDLRRVLDANPLRDRPRAVLCRTVKGKGIDFMEGDLEYHYRPVRGEEREEACRRLQDA